MLATNPSYDVYAKSKGHNNDNIIREELCPSEGPYELISFSEEDIGDSTDRVKNQSKIIILLSWTFS